MMLPIVIPISSTSVNWSEYLSIAKASLNHNVMAAVDDVGMTTDSLATFIAALGALKYPESKALDILRESGSLLKHVFFGFLLIDYKFVFHEIMESSDLSVLSVSAPKARYQDVRLGIISGTLEEWRTSIINGCTLDSPKSLREFFFQCLTHFDRAGLKDIWWNYQKLTDNQDITYIKEKK